MDSEFDKIDILKMFIVILLFSTMISVIACIDLFKAKEDLQRTIDIKNEEIRRLKDDKYTCYFDLGD